MGPAHRGMSTLSARDHRALPRPPYHEMYEMLSQGTPSSQSHREHEGPGGRDAQGCSAHVRDGCASSQVLQTRRNDVERIQHNQLFITIEPGGAREVRIGRRSHDFGARDDRDSVDGGRAPQ